jgi:hypothetical protein
MPSKSVPSASKASAKPTSRAKEEKTESKAQAKKLETLEKYLDEINDLMVKQSENSKQLNTLFRKCASLAGIVKNKKPQSENTYISNEWKKFCNSKFPDRVEKEMEDLEEKRREEGKNDKRGLKASAQRIVANNSKLTDKELYELTVTHLKKAYVEKYLPSFGIAHAGAGKEADVTEGEESEEEAGGSEPEDEDEDEDEGSAKPKSKPVRSASPVKKTTSKKKVSVAESLLAETDD